MKSLMIITLTLGLFATDSGSGFLVRQTSDVIFGWTSAWLRTSPPMKPVAPDNMTFMISMGFVRG